MEAGRTLHTGRKYREAETRVRCAGKAYDIERSRESNECVISLLIPVSTAGMLHGHRRKKFTSPYNPGLGVMVQCPAAVLTKLVEVKRLTFTPSSEPYQAMVSVVYTLLFRLQ